MSSISVIAAFFFCLDYSSNWNLNKGCALQLLDMPHKSLLIDVSHVLLSPLDACVEAVESLLCRVPWSGFSWLNLCVSLNLVPCPQHILKISS